MTIEKPGRMRSNTKRAKQKRETRKRILEAAASLFDEKGFFETSPTDIAKEAGVAYGSVYAHFETKGEILTVLHLENQEDKFKRISALKREGRRPIEQLIYFIEAIWAEDTGEKALGNLIAFISYIWVHGNTSNGLAPEHVYKRFIDIAFALVEEAKRDGDLSPDTDTQKSVEIAVANYLDCIRQAWYEQEKKDKIREKMLEKMIHIFRADPELLEKYKS